jgi:hypothetical protein
MTSSPGPSEPREDRPPEDPTPSVLARDFAEIVEYLSCYLKATFDRGKLSIKEVLWRAIAWSSAIIVVIGILLTAAVFIFYGASLGLSELLGHRLWLGYLSTGLFFLVLISIWIRLEQRHLRKKSLRKEIEDYERTLDKQRSRFGRDLEEVAASSTK